MRIGRKQNAKQDDFLKVFRNIRKLVSRDHIKRLEDEAVEHLIQSTHGKRVEFGWSGGKDSLVLGTLCEKAGITKGISFLTRLEYPDFEHFVHTEKPLGVDVVVLERYDMDYLKKNPTRLFPKQDQSFRWQEIIQRKHLEDHYWREGLDQIILGHRIIDGNHVPSRIYTTRKGYTKNNAIYDWTQEDIIAYLIYNGIPLPDIYFYPDGFKQGTGPWCDLLQTKERTLMDCWSYVFQTEPDIVFESANHFESARDFLKSRRGGHERNITS